MIRQSIPFKSFRALSLDSINSRTNSIRQINFRSARYTDRRSWNIVSPSQLKKSVLSAGASSRSLPNVRDLKLGVAIRAKSSTSPSHNSESGEHTQNDDLDMTKSIRAELVTIKETFSMKQVPRDSLYIGAAGILPYAATSCSTVYLAWDINYAEDTGSGYLMSPETAHHLLDIITPIQIGYGAIIISFLGAIHWGLEFAGYGGKHSYQRLRYGVIAPIIAWPTLLMPVETALISQFLAFNYMYFVDARATVKGWFPPWYSIYRFVLTFFVGASIVTSLISRGQIVSPERHNLKVLKDHARTEREAQFEHLESEESARREAQAETDADEDDENQEAEGEDDSEEE